MKLPMMEQIALSARCMHCDRTITLMKSQRDAMKTVGYMSVVAPVALRPHKCQHGAWCDECRKETKR